MRSVRSKSLECQPFGIREDRHYKYFQQRVHTLLGKAWDFSVWAVELFEAIAKWVLSIQIHSNMGVCSRRDCEGGVGSLTDYGVLCNPILGENVVVGAQG